MLISRRHWQWWTAAGIGFVVSTILYLLIGRTATPEGAYGGTKPGLWFGIVGSVFMLAAAFLAVRKKWPVSPWIKGNARFWLQVHLWFGTLSVWLILLHSGFRFGGPFEQIMMWCFMLVAFSGFYGLGMQQVIPRMMTDRVPAETFSQQVPVLNRRLLVEADWIAAEATTAADVEGRPISRDVYGGEFDKTDVVAVHDELKAYFKEYPAQDTFKPHKIKDVATLFQFVYGQPYDGPAEKSETETDPEANEDTFHDPMAERLRSFYIGTVRPYLRGSDPYTPLQKKATADVQFDSLRSPLPPKLRRAAQDIEQICDVRRQYAHQKRLLWWLHSWLYIHVPASLVLVVLFVVHVWLALRVVPGPRF